MITINEYITGSMLAMLFVISGYCIYRGLFAKNRQDYD